MITKAYVVKQVSSNKFLVRIPVLNSAENSKHSTPTDELSEAILSTLPGASNIVHEGDCVIVGFENNNIGYPIILGHLFAENINKEPVDLYVRYLDMTRDTGSVAKLPASTSIGNVTAQNLATLEGSSLNIRDTLYHTKFYFTDSLEDDPSKLFLGTKWELIPDPRDKGSGGKITVNYDASTESLIPKQSEDSSAETSSSTEIHTTGFGAYVWHRIE